MTCNAFHKLVWQIMRSLLTTWVQFSFPGNQTLPTALQENHKPIQNKARGGGGA